MKRESLGNPLYRRAVKAGLAGLTAVSTGACPGCDVCAIRHRYLDPYSEGAERIAAMARFAEDWRSGKVEDHAEFSSDMCQICSTHLAGDREVFHWIDADDPKRRIQHEDSCCTDCVLYLANGDEPPINRDAIDEFTHGYITALLFSTTDNADESGGAPLDDNYSIEDFDEESMALIVRDCIAFQERMALAIAGGDVHGGDDSTLEHAGRDFWYTRAGHGCGFWDGDWTQGDLLSDAAHVFGEVDVTVEDGKLYLSGNRSPLPAGWIPVSPSANHDHDSAIAEFCSRMGEALGTACAVILMIGGALAS